VILSGRGSNHNGPQKAKHSTESADIAARLGSECCTKKCMQRITMADLIELTKYFRPQNIQKKNHHFNTVARSWLESCRVCFFLIFVMSLLLTGA
jgi:hypothetical protein